MASNIIVRCGDDSLEWNDLATPITELVSQGLSRWLANVEPDGYSEVPNGVRTIHHINRLKSAMQLGKSESLLDGLITCRKFQASDHRDKIFALLGITNHSGDVSLSPDYRASVADVYTACARHLNCIMLRRWCDDYLLSI